MRRALCFMFLLRVSCFAFVLQLDVPQWSVMSSGASCCFYATELHVTSRRPHTTIAQVRTKLRAVVLQAPVSDREVKLPPCLFLSTACASGATFSASFTISVSTIATFHAAIAAPRCSRCLSCHTPLSSSLQAWSVEGDPEGRAAMLAEVPWISLVPGLLIDRRRCGGYGGG